LDELEVKIAEHSSQVTAVEAMRLVEITARKMSGFSDRGSFLKLLVDVCEEHEDINEKLHRLTARADSTAQSSAEGTMPVAEDAVGEFGAAQYSPLILRKAIEKYITTPRPEFPTSAMAVEATHKMLVASYQISPRYALQLIDSVMSEYVFDPSRDSFVRRDGGAVSSCIVFDTSLPEHVYSGPLDCSQQLMSQVQ
jgi:hypothetical protein